LGKIFRSTKGGIALGWFFSVLNIAVVFEAYGHIVVSLGEDVWYCLVKITKERFEL